MPLCLLWWLERRRHLGMFGPGVVSAGASGLTKGAAGATGQFAECNVVEWAGHASTYVSAGYVQDGGNSHHPHPLIILWKFLCTTAWSAVHRRM